MPKGTTKQKIPNQPSTWRKLGSQLCFSQDLTPITYQGMRMTKLTYYQGQGVPRSMEPNDHPRDSEGQSIALVEAQVMFLQVGRGSWMGLSFTIQSFVIYRLAKQKQENASKRPSGIQLLQENFIRRVSTHHSSDAWL